jgi:hypothetical protein
MRPDLSVLNGTEWALMILVAGPGKFYREPEDRQHRLCREPSIANEIKSENGEFSASAGYLSRE